MRDKCIYFNGTLNEKCKKGINYLEVSDGRPLNHYPALPCLRSIDYFRIQLKNCSEYKPYPKWRVLLHELYWKVKNFLSIRYAIIRPPVSYCFNKRWEVEYFKNWTGAWNSSGMNGIITHIFFLPFNYIKYRFLNNKKNKKKQIDLLKSFDLFLDNKK